MKFDQYFTSFTIINSKWIKDLNIRPDTMKHLEENLGGKLLNIGLGDNILSKTPPQKSKNKKWDYIILKRLCTAKNKETKIH